MHKRNDFLEVVEINEAMDALCPQDRASRGQGLFCTASLASVTRWVSANLSCRYPHQPQEISYCGREPYVYPIRLYERASSMFSSYQRLRELSDPRWEEWQEQARAYWDAGVPLSQFKAREQEIMQQPEWDEGYEILIDQLAVKTYRAVSWDRLIAHTENSERLREFKQQQQKDASSKRAARKAATRHSVESALSASE